MEMPHWYGVPDELPEAEKEFMRKHNLAFSSGYIGMLRCYRNFPDERMENGRIPSTTIWQSSSGFVIAMVVACSEPGKPLPLPSKEQLEASGREFLQRAMALPEEKLKEVLDGHVPLLWRDHARTDKQIHART